jgi:hypothetical protein
MTQKDGEEKSVWSLSFWQALSFWTMLVAAITGVIAATSALVSRHAANKASEIVQRESSERIAAALKDAAEANKQAAEANAKAEKERLARLKIEQRLAPRSLSQNGATALYDKAKSFPGIWLTIIMIKDSNRDALPLARQITEALKPAGWKVDISLMDTLEDIKGIFVRIPNASNANTVAAAKILIEELNSDGIPSKEEDVVQNPKHQDNCIQMIIGTRL